MGPPLIKLPCHVDIVATAELDSEVVSKGERRQIKSFIDECFLERQAQQERLTRLRGRQRRNHEYVIHPASKDPDADYPLRRFNCAGFVLSAYLEAGIDLVDQGRAPTVNIGFLKEAYPRQEKHLEDSEFQKAMGIDNGDQWPVIMAGYVVHSLNRSADDIRKTPYVPRPGDEFFPTRDQDVEDKATSSS